MPFEKFSVLEDPKQTLQAWQRKLEYLFNKNLNDDNISSTSLTLGSAQVKASNIDFGTGANQVDASDIPIIDNSSYFSGANIELALAQLGSTILNISTTNLDTVFVAPIQSSGSNLYLQFSTKNLKVNVSSELDTIQNIAATDSPTFANLTITSTVQALTGKFGNSSDYVEASSYGIKFYGEATQFHDELQSLIFQNYVSPTADITINSTENSVTFKQSCSIADYVTMNIQINHGWKVGTPIYPHLHWWQNSTDVPNWLIQYRWQYNGSAKGTAWTNVARVTSVFPYTVGTLNQITTFGAITPTSDADLSDIIQFRLIRDGDNESSAFATTDLCVGSIGAMNFDVHIELDTIGSGQQYAK